MLHFSIWINTKKTTVASIHFSLGCWSVSVSHFNRMQYTKKKKGAISPYWRNVRSYNNRQYTVLISRLRKVHINSQGYTQEKLITVSTAIQSHCLHSVLCCPGSADVLHSCCKHPDVAHHGCHSGYGDVQLQDDSPHRLQSRYRAGRRTFRLGRGDGQATNGGHH